MRLFLLLLVSLWASTAWGATGNVIVIVMDDVGNDIMASYAEEPVDAITPNIDALRAQGVLFRNAYSEPACSPTRAAILSGRNPSEYQNYIGTVFAGAAASRGLMDVTFTNLATVLAAAGYRVEALGKWHLAVAPEFTTGHINDGETSRTESHPNDFGFTYHAGNLFFGLDSWGSSSYSSWGKHTDGVYALSSTYATTDTSTETQAKLGGTEPFFLWVAFNAAHDPLHEPPHGLLAAPGVYNFALDIDKFRAMIEAMDTEIGNITGHGNFDLTDTTVFIVGDNGTDGSLIQGHASNHAKRTVYEGGINVPLIVAGEAVSAANTESAALVQATDLYATILEIAGITNHGRSDSVSFGIQLVCPTCPHLRTVAFAERFGPPGGPIDPSDHDRAIRDSQYKLICMNGETDPLDCEFYDLRADEYETAVLDTGTLTAPQQASFDNLALEMDRRVFQGCCGADNSVQRLQ